MRAQRRRSRPWRQIVLLLVASSAWLSARPLQDDADLEILRRDALAHFEVVPLREGIALAGRTRDRRVEIVDGLVLGDGTPLSGADLRTRLGADASLVLKLSYLSNAQLRSLFAAPPARAVTPSVPVAPPAPPPPPAPPAATPPAASAPRPPGPEPVPARTYHRTGARIGVGKSVTIAEDEEVTQGVVSILGNVTVAGRVRDDVVAVGGSVIVLPTADIRGDITSVGGTVSIAPGATHSGRIHTAVFKDWGGWSWPGVAWSRVTMDPATRWLTLAGTVTRVLLLGFAVGAIVLLARARVSRVGAAVAATPIRAAAIGLGAQILFVPALIVVAISMAITIVGLPFLAIVIPLALVTMLAAMLLGIASLAQTLGRWIADRAGWHADAVAWALGLGFVVLPTVLSRLVGIGPNLAGLAVALLAVGTIVEYVAWTIGLGAAIMTGLGRWSTVPPPVPPMPQATANAPSF